MQSPNDYNQPENQQGDGELNNYVDQEQQQDIGNQQGEQLPPQVQDDDLQYENPQNNVQQTSPLKLNNQGQPIQQPGTSYPSQSQAIRYASPYLPRIQSGHQIISPTIRLVASPIRQPLQSTQIIQSPTMQSKILYTSRSKPAPVSQSIINYVPRNFQQQVSYPQYYSRVQYVPQQPQVQYIQQSQVLTSPRRVIQQQVIPQQTIVYQQTPTQTLLSPSRNLVSPSRIIYPQPNQQFVRQPVYTIPPQQTQIYQTRVQPKIIQQKKPQPRIIRKEKSIFEELFDDIWN